MKRSNHAWVAFAVLLVSSCEEDSGQAEYDRFERNLFLGIESPNELLVEAAKKEHPRASLSIVSKIESGEIPFIEFGSTKGEAIVNLLTTAGTEVPIAKYILGIRYRDEYGNRVKARELLGEASYAGVTEAWYDFAEICASSGTKEDAKIAYFFLSANAAISSPNSPDGERTWKLRNEVAEGMKAEELKKLLMELEDWFVKNGKPDFAILGVSPLSVVGQEIERAEELEREHRKEHGIQIEQRKVDPFTGAALEEK